MAETTQSNILWLQRCSYPTMHRNDSLHTSLSYRAIMMVHLSFRHISRASLSEPHIEHGKSPRMYISDILTCSCCTLVPKVSVLVLYINKVHVSDAHWNSQRDSLETNQQWTNKAGHQLFAMKIVDEDRLVNAQAHGWNKHHWVYWAAKTVTAVLLISRVEIDMNDSSHPAHAAWFGKIAHDWLKVEFHMLLVKKNLWELPESRPERF